MLNQQAEVNQTLHLRQARIVQLEAQLEAALELFNRSQARLADLEILTLRQQARIAQLEAALERECAAHDRREKRR